MGLRDPRLEEFEYLSELERAWSGRNETHPKDTPRRRLIAELILSGCVNGADYLSKVHPCRWEIRESFNNLLTEAECAILHCS
jgi:hypothetical protein